MLENHFHVPLHVEGQMVRPTECSVAELALKRFVAGVLAHVSTQLVRACKAPATILQYIKSNQLIKYRKYEYVHSYTASYKTNSLAKYSPLCRFRRKKC